MVRWKYESRVSGRETGIVYSADVEKGTLCDRLDSSADNRSIPSKVRYRHQLHVPNVHESRTCGDDDTGLDGGVYMPVMPVSRKTRACNPKTTQSKEQRGLAITPGQLSLAYTAW